MFVLCVRDCVWVRTCVFLCVFPKKKKNKCGKVKEMHENAPAHTHSILMGLRENRQTIQRMDRLSLRNSP